MATYSLTYRRDIDGLRCIAVSFVILFHMGADWMSAGFIGVDIFFVISGFLITGLIIAARERGDFTFLGFWSRRFRRIFPALIAINLVTVCAGSILLFPDDLYHFARQSLASLLGISNLFFWANVGDYWGATAVEQPLLHTWSLSVEEQFYFVFPPLLIAALHFGLRFSAIVIFSIAAWSFGIFFLFTINNPSNAFYLPQARAWELGFGALLALISATRRTHNVPLRSVVSDALAALGLCGIFLSLFIMADHEALTAWMALPVASTGALILFAGRGGSGVGAILGNRVFVTIGKASYSLYLVHWPVIVFYEQTASEIDSTLEIVALLCLTACLSAVSYTLIETPFRRDARFLRATVYSLMAGVGISLAATNSGPAGAPPTFAATVWAGDNYNIAPRRTRPAATKLRLAGIQRAADDPPGEDAFKGGGKIRLYGGNEPEIVLLGDSHALMWAEVVDLAASDAGMSVSFYTANGTSPFIHGTNAQRRGSNFFSMEEMALYDEGLVQHLSTWKPRIVMIAVKWDLVNRPSDARPLIQFLESIGARIVLVEQPPVLPIGDRNAPRYLAYRGYTPRDDGSDVFVRAKADPSSAHGKMILKGIMSMCARCSVLPIRDLFDSDGWIRAIVGRHSLYIDDDHLSRFGASLAAERFKSSLMENGDVIEMRATR